MHINAVYIYIYIITLTYNDVQYEEAVHDTTAQKSST